MDLPQIDVESERLRIWKGPGVGQYGILVGLISLGVGAAYFSSDNIVLKCACIVGCLILGVSFLESWEECILDRTSKMVTLRQFSFYQRYLRFKSLRDIHVDLNDIVSVLVKSADNTRKELTPHHTVTLLLRSGVSLPILETFRSQSVSCCDMLAEKIRKFLGLSHMELLQDQTSYPSWRFLADGNSSTDSSDTETSDIENLVGNGRIKEDNLDEVK